MINKMADEASAILYLICWHEVWVKVTYDWSTALWYVDRVFTSQSYKHRHKHKRKLVRFSCAYAHAYVDQVFSCLHMCLTLSLCASKNQADLRVFFQSMDRIKSLFPYKDRLTRAQMSRVVYKASCWDLHMSSIVSLISYLFYIQTSVVIQRLITSEDVCWNIRNRWR